MEIFIARQPIFNRSKKLFGYELLHRSNRDNVFPGTDGDRATSKLLVNTFLNIGLGTLVSSKWAFINFTEEHLLEKTALNLPSDKVIVEVLEYVPPTPAIIEDCTELKKKGYILALDDFVFADGLEPLVELADIIKIDFQEFKSVSSFSAILFLVSALNFSLAYIDIIMISQLRSSYELGIYSCASPLSRMFLSFFIALQAVMLPKFSKFHALNDLKNIKAKLKYAYKISLYSLPFFILSLILSEHIIKILFGSKYIEASNSFRILLFGAYIFGFFAINSSLLQALNMQKNLVYSMLLAVVLDFILNALLIPVYGIEGAASATTISYISATLLSFIFLFQIFSR